MIESLFPRAHARYTSLPVVGGTLDGLCVWLHARGHRPRRIKDRVRAAVPLARALQRRLALSLGELTASALRACAPRPTKFDAQSQCALVRSLVQYLEERGELVQTPPTPSSGRVAEYRRYLDRVRGLAAGSVLAHAATITEFLLFLDYDAYPRRLHELRGADIEAFIAKIGRRVGRVSMKCMTSHLRCFLRFLAAAGEAPHGLVVNSPRIWHGERLPRALPWDAVVAFLRSIDRSTPKGRRDYAMFLLVATYGLRVSEVAALALDDVAWRTRQIRVPRPKVGTPLLLPLTDEAGAALVDYLRRRRAPSSCRALFVRVTAPVGRLDRSAVGHEFRARARSAGIRLPFVGGPHCLRHAVAMNLLRKGTALKTIGDFLGHRSVASTDVYLRLDVDDLADVALPLPAAAVAEEVRR